ncbi:hypothetical protein [Mesorhizobium sp. CN2-181]|uniref:hypothetical protein n=1 Tax=Mesorhizobium yinganensis TaxID=3157707 RepID=UPI0032B71F40
MQHVTQIQLFGALLAYEKALERNPHDKPAAMKAALWTALGDADASTGDDPCIHERLARLEANSHPPVNIKPLVLETLQELGIISETPDILTTRRWPNHSRHIPSIHLSEDEVQDIIQGRVKSSSDVIWPSADYVARNPNGGFDGPTAAE